MGYLLIFLCGILLRGLFLHGIGFGRLIPDIAQHFLHIFQSDIMGLEKQNNLGFFLGLRYFQQLCQFFFLRFDLIPELLDLGTMLHQILAIVFFVH